jgi:hypothetical protein
VLNAKGGEIKGQRKWITQPLVNLKIVEIEFVFRPKKPFIAKSLSYGGDL